MALSEYVIGAGVVLKVTITVDGVAMDPTTLTATIDKPNGTTTTFALVDFTKLSVGVYEKRITADVAGEWNWRVSTTGTAEGADESQFFVRASEVI